MMAAAATRTTELQVNIEYMERRRCRPRHFASDEAFAAYQRRLDAARAIEGNRVIDYPKAIADWTPADLDQIIATVATWLPLDVNPMARIDRHWRLPRVSIHRDMRRRRRSCFYENALYLNRGGFLARVLFPDRLPVLALVDWLEELTFHLDVTRAYDPIGGVR